MTSIVVHYKELALKGKNRPWFIQLLVRNLQTALTGLHVASVRSSMGRIELALGPQTPWPELRDRLSRLFGIANFSYANRGPHDFQRSRRRSSTTSATRRRRRSASRRRVPTSGCRSRRRRSSVKSAG